MTYLQDKKKKKDFYIKVFLTVIALACFILGAATIKGVLLPVSNKIFGTGGQVLGQVSTSVSSGLTTKSSLKQRVLALETENQTLIQKEEQYRIQEKEIQILREALDLSMEEPHKAFGEITSVRSVYGSFLVKTVSKNTQIGDMIVDSLGSLIGFVSTVEGETITAMGLDSLKDPLALYLLDGEMTVEAGKQSRGVLMAKVPRETVVEVGDVAIFSGTQIKVGNVVDFSKDEKDPFKEVYIRMSAKVENGKVVGIIKKN